MKNVASMVRKAVNFQMFTAFHHRNFPFLFISTITMSMGRFMMMVAMGWLVLEMTDSPLSLGMVWACRSTPYLIFGMLAGAVADKVDRQKLLILTFIMLMANAFAMGILISRGRIELWHIFLFTFVAGSIEAFDMAARQAFVVDIVGREDAMSSLAMNAVAMRMIGVVGGIAGGVVIELLGLDWPFYIITIGYLLGLVALLFIRGAGRQTVSEQQSIRRNFVEGLKIIYKNQIVVTLVVMAIICEIFGFSFLVLLPVFARDILNVGASGLGMINAAVSLGGLLALLFLASLGNYKYKGRLILGIFLFYGIFLGLFSQSHWYSTSLIFVGLVGGMASAFDAMQHTMLQLNVNEKQRGRAMGIWQMSIGFGPVGHLAVGAIASFLSAPLALSINGAVIVAIFFIMVVFVPKLRRA